MTVAGPLHVLREGTGDASRVLVYDESTERYWVAFDAPHEEVRLAGSSLIVRNDGVVRRVSLDGRYGEVLHEDDDIRAMWVEDAHLLVWTDDTIRIVSLDGSAAPEISVESRVVTISYGSRRVRLARNLNTGLVHHAGEIDGIVSSLSPDGRYEVRSRGLGYSKLHGELFSSLVVIDVESGSVLWTADLEDGGFVQPFFAGLLDSWWGDASTVTSAEPRYLPFRESVSPSDAPQSYASTTVVKLVDVVTGEVRPMTEADWPLLRGRYWSDCSESVLASGSPCRVWSDGRVVWEGAKGWTTYLGVVEPVAGLELRGITPVEVAPEPVPSDRPAHAEIVGPLLVYEVQGSYGDAASDSLPSRLVPRDVMVRDEGTGRTWRAFTLYIEPWAVGDPSRSQTVDGGIVARVVRWPGPDQPVGTIAALQTELTYFALEGEPVTLLSEPLHQMELTSSPDGAHLAVAMRRFVGTSVMDLSVVASVRVFSFPAGTAGSVFTNDLLEPPRYWSMGLADWGTRGWSDNGTTFVLGMNAPYDWLGSAMATVDGGFRILSVAPSLISPSVRYAAVVREASGPGRHGFHITDFQSGEILWSVDGPNAPRSPSWAWVSGHQFAWSSGSYVFHFDRTRPDPNEERWQISVIDVETGGIEVIGVADYLARFRPTPHAAVECPEHPAQPCRVTLDSTVVAEGRWPLIVGLIEID